MRMEQTVKPLGATDRALLVLVRETRRMDEAAERVRLVVQALAQRRGVISAGEGAGGE